MIVAEAALPRLRVALGTAQADEVDTGALVLSGESTEAIFAGARAVGRAGRVALFEADGWLLGAASAALTHGVEVAAGEIYFDVFRAARGRHLARIWNYVPAINAPGDGGLENYRLFCRGRSRAFEQHHGAQFKLFLPSASAVGCSANTLTVIFAASRAQPRHVENPLQVPAYDYPNRYGPHAPSFARATFVPDQGAGTVFISGTAAIRGHATVAPHRTLEQLDCTLENLRGISLACGIGPDLGATGRWKRHFKVYLRHASDLAAVSAVLEQRLVLPNDVVSYLHSDICRAALNVEIEATLSPLPALAPIRL